MESDQKGLVVLKRRSDFLRLVSKGRRIHASGWFFLSVLPNGLDRHRWGWTVSGRVGGAVLRNRIKRWSRNASRALEPSLSSKEKYDINLVFKQKEAGFYRKIRYGEFYDLLSRALARLV